MSDDSRLQVVLCWHMHQPQYRDLISGNYTQPWTYLHAIKDYTDMAAHLEAVPNAQAVINVVPVLFEQLADYGRQITGFLTDGASIRDPLLVALVQTALPVGPDERILLMRACLRANEQRMIQRFPVYQRLASIARTAIERHEFIQYLHESYFSDLLMWYHLAWIGETVRRSDARVQRLMDKGEQYSLHDRRELLAIIGELISGLVARYRRLSDAGQVELSVTPYAHPILPLLLNPGSARESIPEALLPRQPQYPDGAIRARWHVDQGLAAFERDFGFRPRGCWPSEGAVSNDSLQLLGAAGFGWAATGETVLSNSLRASGAELPSHKAAWLYQPYRIGSSGVSCFFRDDTLSDLIGFTYSTWHADDAVANLVHQLEEIATTCRGRPDRIVSIILDGENAWEHYPENGYYFLSALYRRLSDHPKLALTTFSRYLAQHRAAPMPSVTAGSWVYGTLSTWIGDVDKNRGWDMLIDAKQVYDQKAPTLTPKEREAAERQLAICEGSDWFWWFGDYNPEDAVSNFERLFRQHLTNLYQLLHVEPPEYLAHVFAHGHGAPTHGGTMRPGQVS